MRILILTLLAALALQTAAVEVSSTPGALQQSLSGDLAQVTELKVSGTMDARDFRFIADSLDNITNVDLSEVTIVAFSNTTTPTLGRQHTFAAGELPRLSFMHKPLTRVVLPKGATLIGEAAFTGCEQLATVEWGSALDSIAPYAFAGCKTLEQVSLPATVRAIGEGAFAWCDALTTFAVEGDARLRLIGARAFADCKALNAVTLGGNINTIGEGAFAHTAITALDLAAQDRLQQLGGWSLANMPLATLSLPAGLNRIGEGALWADKDVATLTLPASVAAIGSYAMAGMTGLSELTTEAQEVPQLGDGVWYGVDQPAVTLRVPAVAKADYQAALQWQDFTIVANMIPGDVNLDGLVNVGDVNVVLNIIIAEGTSDHELFERADVNRDGNINVGDANAILNMILQQRIRRRALTH